MRIAVTGGAGNTGKSVYNKKFVLSQITAKSISETVYVSEFRKVFGKFLLK